VTTSTPLILPDNLPECHAVIKQLHACVEQQQAQIESLQAHMEQLNRDLAALKRQLFGSRRERFLDPEPAAEANDLAKIDGSVSILAAEPVPAFAPHLDLSATAGRRTSKGRQQRGIDPTIPREKVYHHLDESSVPAELLQHPRARRFFRLVREEVDYQPARLRVVEHYQEVIILENDVGESRFATAAAPPALSERCYLGAGLLAYLVASRFADHLPYYREEDILARTGFTLHRATQWRCLRALAQIVQPLVELLQQRILQSEVLGIDETPCPMLSPGLGRTRSVYLYAKYGAATHPYVSFDFAAHKDETNVRRIVGDYRGYLQSDAYICYDLVAAASANGIVPVACWAHARRKFEPLVNDGPHAQAAWIMREIQKLYDIEDRARNLSDSERHALRQAEARPLLNGIEAWLEERTQRELPRSPLRTGVNYLHKRWPAFTRYLESGAIPIDNNRTEAAIKGPVMGKKAWLFLGHEHAGKVAAAFYTLTMTCKRHHIDVYAYLLDVFRHIGKATSAELEGLLPDRWIQAHPEARVRQRVQESHAAAHRKRRRRARRRAVVPSG
jgi:transposase